jgi:hypothetical protein
MSNMRLNKRRRLSSTCTSTQRSYVFLSTRSKDSNMDSQADETSKTKERSYWTEKDEQALVKFLLLHKAEAGDGANFKKQVWIAAAVEMAKHTTKGAPKTWSSCQSKWGRVRILTLPFPILTDCSDKQIKEAYQIVNTLMNLSGFAWSPDSGVGIKGSPVEVQIVWKDYIAVRIT